jgi:uncharacterized protein YndB with AHSA1/START domain
MNDYATVVTPDTVRMERLLPGPIERVWAYLTESQKRQLWLAAGPMELQVGGRVEHVFRNSELTPEDQPPPAKYAALAGEHRTHGQVLACEPPRLLSYTWSEGDHQYSEVRFELEACGEHVRLMLTHARLANRELMLSVAAGWHTHLDILTSRLSGTDPAGFWAMHTRLEAEYEQRIPGG